MGKNIGITLLGILYPCVFLSHSILLEKMSNGFALIIFMYGISETFDAFAFLFGKLFGRKKIFPTLSPKKTYTGVFFGTFFALAMAMLLNRFVTKLPFWVAVVGAIVLVIFTLLGDLAASKLKRDLGVKDFGNVLPKQGGVLDIYDSLIFVSPVFYAYLKVTGLG
jgi:phosphatidate cytidylyltransferase